MVRKGLKIVPGERAKLGADEQHAAHQLVAPPRVLGQGGQHVQGQLAVGGQTVVKKSRSMLHEKIVSRVRSHESTVNSEGLTPRSPRQSVDNSAFVRPVDYSTSAQPPSRPSGAQLTITERATTAARLSSAQLERQQQLGSNHEERQNGRHPKATAVLGSLDERGNQPTWDCRSLTRSVRSQVRSGSSRPK